MTPEELKSLRRGDMVIVNGRKEHIGDDKFVFVGGMEHYIGKMFRIKDTTRGNTVRLMDECGDDIGYYWYPSHLTRVIEDIEPIPETEFMKLVYGA